MTTTNENFNVKNGLNVAQNASVGGTVTAGYIGVNVNTSSKWASPMPLSQTGDLTGIVSFDGSSNVTLNTTLAATGVAAGTYSSIIVNAKGLVTSGLTTGASNPDITGVLRTSTVSLSGYLPLSTPSISYTYAASLYPALGTLLGVSSGNFITPTFTGTLGISNANWYVKT